MRKTLFLFIFSLLAFAVSVRAQQPPGGGPKIGKVSGTVTAAASGEPVEYAVVTLIRLKDSLTLGATTNNKGFFQVAEVPPGMFRLKVAFVGFRNYLDTIQITPEKPEVFLEKIQLKDLTTEEVKITAEAEMIQSGIDKKVYNVGKDISSAGTSAADILQNVPSVTIDMDKNIQLRGSANVNILINGRPSTLTGQGGLEQLPASMIERIEVVTNPSAKYDPDGMSGIINIITRNSQNAGLSGSASMTVGTNAKYNPSLYLNYRTQKMNLYANLSGQYNRNFQRSIFDRQNFFADTSFTLYQNSDGFNIQQSWGGTIGADFTLSPLTTLGASGTYSYRVRDEYSHIFYDFINENDSITQEQERVNYQNGRPVAIEGSAYLKRIFKTSDHNLMFDLAYSQTNNIEDLDATQYYTTGLFLPNYFQHTTADRRNRIITPQINYTRPFKNGHKLETGVKAILRNIDQDFSSQHRLEGSSEWTGDSSISNRIIYDDQVLSVYGVYTGVFKKIGYSLGLRAEQTFYTVNQATLNDKYENQYFSLFPTAAFKHKFKNLNEIGLSYSRRINRPSIEQLNPFPEWRDPYNFMQGNPYLRPEYTHSIELSYRGLIKKLNYTTSVYYRQTDSAITRYRTVTDEGIATVEFSNISRNQSVGAEIILQWEPFKWWNMNLSFNGFYQVSNADNIIQGLSNDGFGGNIRYLGNLKFWKTASAQIIYNYMFPFIVPQGRGGPGNWLDIGLRKEFLKDNRLGITVRVTDILNMREFRLRSQGENFIGAVNWKRESRIAYFGVSYRFGSGKPQQQPKRPGEDQPQMEGF